jgi:release factor glutamine methyltransferase
VTVSEALGLAAARLAAAGVPDPDLDSELLLRHALGWDRTRVLTDARSSLDPADQARFLSLVAERATRLPLQHLTRTQAFWRHEFLVNPDVLIPRPETEVLVEACLDELRGRTAPRVVDVGTGSGCIAICMALERPDAEVHAVEVSAAALGVAAQNARRLGAAVRFHAGSLLEPVSGDFDLVASNPPYVAASEIEGLEPEVRDHEPRLALVPPGGDRYALYASLVPEAARALRPGGSLVLEIGIGMDADVGRLCEAAGLLVRRVLPDLQGIPRTLVARKPGYPAASLPE